MATAELNTYCDVLTSPLILETKIEFRSIDAKVTEQTLQIAQCDPDPAGTVRSFWLEHSSNNRAVLWSLLDYACVGEQLPCGNGVELFREPVAAVPSAGEISVHIGDDVSKVVSRVVAQLGGSVAEEEGNDSDRDTADTVDIDRIREFIILRKICATLPHTCAAQQIQEQGQTSTTTALQLDATFDIVERQSRAHDMNELTSLAGDMLMEGNLWTDASLGDAMLQRKRECAVFAMSLLVPAPKTLLEVGFNAGHSLSMFLSTIPSIETVYELDICAHAYVHSNFQMVKSKFRTVNMSLICGDSKVTLRGKTIGDLFEMEMEVEEEEEEGKTTKKKQNKKKKTKADVIHIDGGHDFDTAWLDIVNAGRFARRLSDEMVAKGNELATLLIIDNVENVDSLEGAVAAAVDAGVVEIIGGATGACRYGSVFAWYQ